ncbi:hypothetical protein B0H13DRAFT_1902476 [Mycena leptocephala]|nr:hypothetical protein B0H13DRAFT_1902476 [Mycena leptocephala]
MAERPYDESDFEQLNSVGLKRRKPYVVMLERQLEQFPKELLLDPEIGFTTNLPGEHTPGSSQIPHPHLSEPPNPNYAGEQQTSPTPGLEDTMLKIQPDVRNVQLRIRDRPSGSSKFNIIQRVSINVVDNVDCVDYESSSMEIFKELQASIGQLGGIFLVTQTLRIDLFRFTSVPQDCLNGAMD